MFVELVSVEMLKSVVTENGIHLIVKSDNCSAQYKSAQHFFHLHELSTEKQIPIIRIYGIAGHGKGEVDHVGGLAKITIRREISGGGFFLKRLQKWLIFYK